MNEFDRANIFDAVRFEVLQALRTMVMRGELPPVPEEMANSIVVEPPRDPAHGDMATNAAMVLARAARVNPRQLAERIAAQLTTLSIDSAEPAGPGFINMRLRKQTWMRVLQTILTSNGQYGARADGDGDGSANAEPVNVEYVSANPTGPMHVGHARGAVVGDVLCNVLEKAGRKVIREYYVNDAGAQVDALARSAWLRYREACGESVTIPKDLYPGDYLRPVGEALREEHGEALLDAPDAEWLPVAREAALTAMMALIRADLAALGVRHDVFTSERDLVRGGKVDALMADLTARDLIYEGTLPPPKGGSKKGGSKDSVAGQDADAADPARPQTLFRATAFGDDSDRPLKKADGGWTYFATDIACHHDKFRRGFTAQVDVLGADHGGYVKRIRAALKATSEGAATLDALLCQMVRLVEDGRPVKMSKRAGNFVSLRDLVDRVGRDAVRFMMLTRRSDAPLDFDLGLAVAQSRDNPVFYVQYAHARCCSVLRAAAEAFPDVPKDKWAESELVGPDIESHPYGADEMALIRRMGAWPRVVDAAAAAREPHRIAFYLIELASAFHALWTRGREDTTLRFIAPDDLAATRARLALVAAVRAVIASGLGVMGVEPARTLT